MKKLIFIFVTAFVAMSSLVAGADEFSDYVSACKTELGFDSIPQFSCEDIEFRGPNPNGPFIATNDYVAHRQINGSVDALFACRWVSPGEGTAATGEMLVHNRFNGKTCFFQLQRPNTDSNGTPFISTVNPPSPTASSAYLYWDSPSNTAQTQCTRCHSAGPYIASSPIVAALAQYGVINDQHDIVGARYTAVGSIGPTLNAIAVANRNPLASTCAGQCHLLGGITPSKTVESSVLAGTGAIIIPSINIAIGELTGVSNPEGFTNLESMPPYNSDSTYRWVNMGSPIDSCCDIELLTYLQSFYPKFYCDNPVSVEARVVDSDVTFSTSDVPDNLNRFNLQDGLVCLNNDQPGGHQCHDYYTRYMCNGRLTAWQSNDDPSYSGDWEPRGGFKGLCASPTAIQARWRTSSTSWGYADGPPDRLAEFDTNGLFCNNEDQNNGQCSNYAVRFNCP